MFYDILIIGSGAAGLTTALHAPAGARIAVLSKMALDSGTTNWAQGGIAAAIGPDDDLQSHIDDTLSAGGGLCVPDTVRFVAENAPAAIDWLDRLGIALTREESREEDGSKLAGFHLTREGGHSRRRIVHAADATGRALQECLVRETRERTNIDIFESHVAVNLISGPVDESGTQGCVGAYVLDSGTGKVQLFRARAVVLATGGASRVYLYSSNPDGATGDGVALAWRVGCRVANMEFTQFHPTCMYHPDAKSFLITEAVRGEGGLLRLPDGSSFLEKFDPRGELAPRDIVARAIDHEMKRLGIDNVWLDISHQPADFVVSHFPTIHRRCLEFGFDITRQAIPVVPAAHYSCGGIVTDLRGRTDVPGLYAVGECTFTGLHGANRLASNSLLECLVLGRAAAQDLGLWLKGRACPSDLPDWDEGAVSDSDEEVVVSHNWDELRSFMWDYVGIVRTTKRLQRAQHRVDLLSREVQEYYASFRVTADLLELRNLTVVADLIVRSALARRESRGLHYTTDFPDPDLSQPPRNTVLVPENFAGRSVPVTWGQPG